LKLIPAFSEGAVFDGPRAEGAVFDGWTREKGEYYYYYYNYANPNPSLRLCVNGGSDHF